MPLCGSDTSRFRQHIKESREKNKEAAAKSSLIKYATFKLKQDFKGIRFTALLTPHYVSVSLKITQGLFN